MHTFLHKRFRLNLDKLTQKPCRILVALSSGQDSICIMKLLSDCFKSPNYVCAIYIDHQWRKDSRSHAQHIINIMSFMKVPVSIYQINQLALSENDARKARYQILIQHALQEKCHTVILGHNSSDKVETVLSNLMRGSGLNGITHFSACKKISKQLSFTRPLINFTKAEIAWLCRTFHLPIWSDSTNYNLNLRRNRIRHELLPYIQNFFNPKIQEALGDFAELCQTDNEYIKENTVKLYMKSRHKTFASINLDILNNQHQSLRKRVVQLYLHYHFGKRVEGKIEDLISRINKKSKASINFNGLVLKNRNGWLYAQITNPN